MKSPQSNSRTHKPSKIVTTMHIYNANNTRSGKINPEPTTAKEIEARRRKQDINTGQLFVEGQGINRALSGRLQTKNELRLSPSLSNINSESRIRQTEKEKQQRQKGVSAASILFEEQKLRHMPKSPQLKAPKTAPCVAKTQQRAYQGRQQSPSNLKMARLMQSQRHPKQQYVPLKCPICREAQCNCHSVGGSYKNCPHCRRQQLNMSINQHRVPDIEAVKYLQDQIMTMLRNDFTQF